MFPVTEAEMDLLLQQYQEVLRLIYTHGTMARQILLLLGYLPGTTRSMWWM